MVCPVGRCLLYMYWCGCGKGEQWYALWGGVCSTCTHIPMCVLAWDPSLPLPGGITPPPLPSSSPGDHPPLPSSSPGDHPPSPHHHLSPHNPVIHPRPHHLTDHLRPPTTTTSITTFITSTHTIPPPPPKLPSPPPLPPPLHHHYLHHQFLLHPQSLVNVLVPHLDAVHSRVQSLLTSSSSSSFTTTQQESAFRVADALLVSNQQTSTPPVQMCVRSMQPRLSSLWTPSTSLGQRCQRMRLRITLHCTATWWTCLARSSSCCCVREPATCQR